MKWLGLRRVHDAGRPCRRMRNPRHAVAPDKWGQTACRGFGFWARPHRKAAGRAGVLNIRWYQQYPARRIVAERGNVATNPLKPPL